MIILQSNAQQVEKERRIEIQNIEYLGNEKSFLDEIKSIFCSFWRAIIWWKNKNLMKIADTSFNKTAVPWLCKKWLQYRHFPVNFANFLKTPFLQKTSGRLRMTRMEKIIWFKFCSILQIRNFWFTYGIVSWNLSVLEDAEAIVQRCSVKKLFCKKISQNSQENTCAIVFFLLGILRNF